MLDLLLIAVEKTFNWDIDSFGEEQVFEVPQYGLKLVIPPLAVQSDNESIRLTAQVVADDCKFPEGYTPVSSLYKIQSSKKFDKPLDLHLKHNVVLGSEDLELAFATCNDLKDGFQMTSEKQEFNPNDNAGKIQLSDSSVYAAIVCKNDAKLLARRYSVKLFYQQVTESDWDVKAVIVPNLGPYLEVLKQ